MKKEEINTLHIDDAVMKKFMKTSPFIYNELHVCNLLIKLLLH